jgi:phosphinothricin acetyltransferase
MDIVVRAAIRADWPALVELYNHYIRTTVITFDHQPYSVETRAPWFAQFGVTGRHRLLVATQGEDVIGYAASMRYRPKAGYDTSVEMSVYCTPDHVGRGVGGRLYTELFAQLAFEPVHRALAGITLPNPESIALHERFGFMKIGTFTEQGWKLGRYWDVAWYEKAL